MEVKTSKTQPHSLLNLCFLANYFHITNKVKILVNCKYLENEASGFLIGDKKQN